MTLPRQLLIGIPLLIAVGIGGALWVKAAPDRDIDAALEGAHVLQRGKEWKSPYDAGETSVTTNLRFESARLDDMVTKARRHLTAPTWREMGSVATDTPMNAVAFAQDENGDWANLTHRFPLLRKIFPRKTRLIPLYPWPGNAVGVDEFVMTQR